MAHLDTEQRAHQALTESTRVVRAYAGSDLSAHVIDLLNNLAASYCLDLINVRPEGLLQVQSALKQVTRLRDVFANEGLDIPKI